MTFNAAAKYINNNKYINNITSTNQYVLINVELNPHSMFSCLWNKTGF